MQDICLLLNDVSRIFADDIQIAVLIGSEQFESLRLYLICVLVSIMI